VVIDVGHPGGDMDILVEGATLVEARMRDSGFFKEVGFGPIGQLIPELVQHLVAHLPVLFTERELEEKIKPLLAPGKIRRTLLKDNFS
jgi:hypothetical protein